MPLVDIRAVGPLFDGRAGRATKDMLRELIKDLVAEGERKVKLNLYPGHGVVTGHYRRSIHGVMKGSMHGLVHDSQVVYGPWLEGTSSRNKASRFKGYRSFRQAREHVDKLAGQKLRRSTSKLVSKIG